MRPASWLAWLVVLVLAAVSASAQGPAPLQSHSDAYWYGRFGYGTIAGERRFGGPSLAFGRRIERNALGIDVLLFSVQATLLGTTPDLDEVGGVYTHAYSASLMTLKGLYFVRPRSRTTAYLGAGAGWRALSFGRSVDIDEQWHGKGLEGEVTVGYALARAATSTRFFLEADVTRPFYRAKRYSNREAVTGDRYAPALVISLGVGW